MSCKDCKNTDQIDFKVEARAIVARIGTTSNKVIPILQAIQDTFNYLPGDAVQEVCKITDITPAQIAGVASFYSQFRHAPAGKHIIKVCTGTACHVKGAVRVYDSFRQKLDLKGKESTDKDGLFSVEEVACLGCCTLAPVVQIDDVTYGHVSTDKVNDVINDFLTKQDIIDSTPLKKARAKEQIQGEIRIGLGSCCVASGSENIRETLKQQMDALNISANINAVGCVGICNQVPLVEIVKPNETKLYTQVKEGDIKQILRTHFKSESLGTRIKNSAIDFFNSIQGDEKADFLDRHNGEEVRTTVDAFLNKQKHIATEHSGINPPLGLKEYRINGGFEALQKCLQQIQPQEIIDIIKSSGLRGRGGAGFPTGIKWELASKAQGDVKYLICNGDEGDPGAFMDRMLLESYPFRIIEGMLIAAFATGATHGYFYIRAEYPLAVDRIRKALEMCRENNLVGTNVLKSSFSFDMDIVEGAGAFVCGEETALIASIEGQRGYPRLRPPYPVESGLFGKPTLINNTETFSMISWILRNGAEAFKNIGVDNSAGTKVFALAGKIKRGGLIEVPMGITVREVVELIGGGIANNRTFKAVQIGGPSGGCIPASLAHTSIDFQELAHVGAMMGSGGLVVLDDTDCMVDIARYFLSFTQDQSCGKCTFCRVGTRRMLDILDRLCKGEGKKGDLENLEELAYQVQAGSICGLGKTAPNPVLSTLKYFRDEYEAHLKGECPSKKCADLIYYEINDDCFGCTKCAQKCPVEAITFLPHQKHSIRLDLCTKCDICRTVCPVDAVVIKTGIPSKNCDS